MGQTLSEPVLEKHRQYGEDQRFIFAVSEMQGWRLCTPLFTPTCDVPSTRLRYGAVAMEDAHAAVLDLDQATPNTPGTVTSTTSTASSHDAKTSFFAVYDGHGGSTIAQFTGETLHFRLRATEAYRAKDYRAALKEAFLGTDVDLRSSAFVPKFHLQIFKDLKVFATTEPDFLHDPSGCTAVVALVTPENRIFVANAGDSRSIMSNNGAAKALSFDHKPSNEEELARIKKAGGFVDFGRVNGNLALSRAIGDFEFKAGKALSPEEQIVTANPEIIEHEASPDDEFLVIACDGIWDVLQNQDVVDWIRRGIAARTSLQDIADQVVDQCMAPNLEWGGVGCDNMTIMIVALLGGRTKEEWYDEIARRVDGGIGYATPATFQHAFAESNRVEVPKQPKYVISTTGLPPNLVNAMVSAGIVTQEHVDREQADRENSEKKDATTLASEIEAGNVSDATAAIDTGELEVHDDVVHTHSPVTRTPSTETNITEPSTVPVPSVTVATT